MAERMEELVQTEKEMLAMRRTRQTEVHSLHCSRCSCGCFSGAAEPDRRRGRGVPSEKTGYCGAVTWQAEQTDEKSRGEKAEIAARALQRQRDKEELKAKEWHRNNSGYGAGHGGFRPETMSRMRKMQHD